MTPAARVQAAIEILDEVITACRDAGPAADTLLRHYFRKRRYAGSKDRRAVRALVYETIRTLGERPSSGRAALLGARPDLAALFGEGPHAPPPLAEGEPRAASGSAPHWLLDRLGTRFDPAMLTRAPIDIRVNSIKASRNDLKYLGDPIKHLPQALRGGPDDIAHRSEFVQGLVEIQDAGSQHVVRTCGAAPDELTVDLCAGAGGKALALAADMQNRGRIVAADVDRKRLSQLPQRAQRAGVSIIETRLMNPGTELPTLADLNGKADLVLIDAPCSGTGTWRRNPEAKWRMTPERLQRLTQLQRRLLEIGERLVRPGGRLVYAVCSLLPEEGEAQISWFHKEYPHFKPVSEQLLTPQDDETDGFFIARSENAC